MRRIWSQLTAYYNEHDPYAAQWLKNLIVNKLIPYGVVDQRDILDVRPSDIKGFTSCHFFAGLGGWPYALRLAGWPDNKPVWTGSCPCQPFSAAGKSAAFDDERHLWPALFHLIEQCEPERFFGEQVASKDGLAWLDLVQADMEGASYAVGAVDTCAAGFGAPHIRHRLYIGAARLADGESRRWGQERQNGNGKYFGDTAQGDAARFSSGCGSGRLADASGEGLQGRCSAERTNERSDGQITPRGSFGAAHPTNGFWKNADWLGCRDEKWRPVEPGAFPLVDGIPGRVGRLRAYGNAIVPHQAATFIGAFEEATKEQLR